MTRMEKYKELRDRIKSEAEESLKELENEIQSLFEGLYDDKNNDVTYIDTLNIKGKDINVWCDDYGQCLILRWIDDNGNIQEESCGTYNTDYKEYAMMKFDRDYALTWYRDNGIILATDREYMCKKIAKMINELPNRIKNKYLLGMPFIGRSEQDIFDMIYGNWGKQNVKED